MRIHKQEEVVLDPVTPITPATPVTPAAPILSRKNLFDSAKAANLDDSSVVEELSVHIQTPKPGNP